MRDISEVVLNTIKVAPTLGLSFGSNEKRFGDLLSAIEKDWIGILKMGLLFQLLRGRGSSKIWNAPLILMLEAVALVGV